MGIEKIEREAINGLHYAKNNFTDRRYYTRGFEKAADATYLLAYCSREIDHNDQTWEMPMENLPSVHDTGNWNLGRIGRDAIRFFDRRDRKDTSLLDKMYEEYDEFYRDRDYTAKGLWKDWQVLDKAQEIRTLGSLGRLSEVRDVYLEIQEFGAYTGGLQKPSRPQEVVDRFVKDTYQVEANKIRNYFTKAEQSLDKEGFDPKAIPERIGELQPNLEVLQDQSLNKKARNLLRKNAKTAALQNLEALRDFQVEVDDNTDNSKRNIHELFFEARRYASEGGLGWLYAHRLSDAKRKAEMRLLSSV